ncbi:unnamed protein product [Ectocarpus sp. 13 AM-2016]
MYWARSGCSGTVQQVRLQFQCFENAVGTGPLRSSAAMLPKKNGSLAAHPPLHWLPLLLYYHAHSTIEAIAGEDSSRANHFRAARAQTLRCVCLVPCVVWDPTLEDGARRDVHDHAIIRHGAIEQLALSAGAVNVAFTTQQSIAMASSRYWLART